MALLGKFFWFFLFTKRTLKLPVRYLLAPLILQQPRLQLRAPVRIQPKPVLQIRVH